MMSQFKQSKESARVAVALGILEIINCVTLVTPNENELFRAFDEFLFTYRPKFEEWLFKPRKKPFFTGYLVNLFLPRYAALEFYKRQKPDGIACKKVLELAEHKYGNIGLVVFIKTVYDYCSAGPSSEVLKENQTNLFNLLSQRFTKAMKHLQTISDNNKNDLYSYSVFVRMTTYFITGFDYPFSIYCMMDLYGNQESVKANKQLNAFIHSNYGFDQVCSILNMVLPVYIEHFIDNSIFLVHLLREFLTFTDKWVKQLQSVSSKLAMKQLTELSVNFRSLVEKAIVIPSPTLISVPFIFYRFLKWEFLVIETTNSYDLLANSPEFIKANEITIFLLQSCTLDSVIDACNELLEEKLKIANIKYQYTFPIKSLPENDDVVIPSLQFIFSHWVNITNKLNKVEANSNEDDNYQSSNPYLLDTIKEKISSNTLFLCKYIHFLKTMPLSDNKNIPVEQSFIDITLKYLDITVLRNEKFTNSFKEINKYTFPNFITSACEFINTKYKNLEFSNRTFWINMINLLTSLLESNQLQEQEDTTKIIEEIEKIIYVFVSLIQISAFGDNIRMIIQSLARFLQVFYSLNIKKNLFLQRSIITTLIEISLSNRVTRPSMTTIPIGNILEVLFTDFHFDLSDLIPSVSESSSKEDAIQLFSFVLCSFNLLLQDISSNIAGYNNYVSSIQKCVMNILSNNADYVWQLYVEFLSSANQLLKLIIIESLSLMFKAEFHSIQKNIVRDETESYIKTYLDDNLSDSNLSTSSKSSQKSTSSFQSQKSTSSKTSVKSTSSKQSTKSTASKASGKSISSKQSGKSISSKQSGKSASSKKSRLSFNKSRKSSILDSSSHAPTSILEPKIMTIEEASKVYDEIHINNQFHPKYAKLIGKEHIYNLLIQNNFEVFNRPPTNNINFLTSAISCCITFHIHDEVFLMMTKKFKKKKSSLLKNNQYTLFYTAWFKKIIENWKIEEFIVLAKPKKIKEFIQAINPNLAFVYYFQKFNNIIKDETILKDLFIECFIKPILTEPKLYNKPYDTKKMGLNVTEFITLLKENQLFDNLIKSIIQAEPYYPTLTTNTFKADKDVVLAFLSDRPPIINKREYIKHNVTHVIKKIPEPSIEDQIKMRNFQWFKYLGKTSNDCHGYFMYPSQIPNVSFNLNLYHYISHFSHMKKRTIEFFINARELSPRANEFFTEHFKYVPPEFIKKIFRLTILNPSPQVMKAFGVFPLNNDNLCVVTNHFDGDKLLYFPAESFGDSYYYRGQFNVQCYDTDCILYIGVNSFILEVPFNVNDTTIITNQKIEVNLIRNININGKQVTFNINGGKTIEMITNAGNYINSAYESMISRKDLVHGFSCIDTETNISPNYKAELIALSLFLLNAENVFFNPSLQLFEAAINDDDNSLINCDVFTKSHNLNILFKEVEKSGLLDEVIICLMKYLKSMISYNNQSKVVLTTINIQTLTILIPLIIKFLNKSTNLCYISIVTHIMLKFCMNQETCDILYRLFWNEIESRTSLEIILPIIFTSNYPIITLRCILQSLMEKSSKIMGELIIDHYLDGTIRRKSFDNYMSIEKIFQLIPSLSFRCNDFMSSSNLPYLLFCSVVAGIHSHKENAENVKTFINISLESIDQTTQSFTLIQNQLEKLLRNPRVLSAFDLINIGGNIARIIDTKVYKEYQKLMTKEQIGDNPNIWYIKAAAAVYNEVTDSMNYQTAQKYVELLPSLLSSDFPTLKLSLAFSTLTKLIDTFPLDSIIPIALFWPTLLSTCSSSTLLRKSSLLLLYRILDTILPKHGYKNVVELTKTLDKSPSISKGIKEFGDSLEISFTDNIPYAIVKTLNKVYEDNETQKLALDCTAVCLRQLTNYPSKAAYFVLPFIAYSTEDCNWILRLKFKNFNPTSFPQIIFSSFDKRNLDEISLVATYLGSKFFGLNCSNKIETISECLIYGMRKFPHVFAPVQGFVLEKCWKMLESEQNYQRIDIVASVIATFFGVVIDEDVCAGIYEGSVTEENLFKQIVNCVDGLKEIGQK